MKLTKIVTLSTLALAAATVVPTLVSAEEAAIYGSKGQIQFTPNTDPTDPVDPIDPINPIDPIDPIDPTGPNPGTNGPLSIDFASSFDFGIQKITSVTETYTAAAQAYKPKTDPETEPEVEPEPEIEADEVIKTGPNFVQVTDNRGTEAGWILTVTQSQQFTSTSGNVLTGAQITLSNGEISTASDSANPTASATTVLKTDGTASQIMAATEGQGAGTYLTRWGSDVDLAATSIELEVPGSTTKYAEVYSTDFVWSLSDVPTNN